jgi:hypothetical protein
MKYDDQMSDVMFDDEAYHRGSGKKAREYKQPNVDFLLSQSTEEVYNPDTVVLAKKVVADGEGLRYNEGKPRFDLMPPEALIALADHYRKGSEKYADRNWERGMDWGKCFASMERHAWAWASGEDYDAETESHHMIAVAWNALALYVYHKRNIGKDTRSSK